MTSDVDPDLLALVRDAERQAVARRRPRKAQAMSRADREAYLRRKGWRRTSPSGSQQWTDGTITRTLSGATAEQLSRDAGRR
jgi:hypothetical protein